jgi:hypothetical protein
MNTRDAPHVLAFSNRSAAITLATVTGGESRLAGFGVPVR